MSGGSALLRQRQVGWVEKLSMFGLSGTGKLPKPTQGRASTHRHPTFLYHNTERGSCCPQPPSSANSCN